MKRNFYLPPDERSQIRAVLGPTNTGKTHHALSRMMGYKNGVIGFPLRLLARENYDRLVAEKGKHRVALVTGEEKILPDRADYFVCTVEAMPVERSFDFLAVDEIQLCADPERGHIFTDRLLRARGRFETVFMGAETIRPVMKRLIPGIIFESRERLSSLEYSGFKKLSRLPKRSAVVAFSLDDVYRMAEMIRRHRGGTAIVLGALSPRTRNAQVDMYQSGEVDFMVATDAIGMGLNMDIRHVALAATRKFDGKNIRTLNAAEMAQIAGRAGRAKKDGTFGVTGPVHDLPGEMIEAIRLHTFDPLSQVIWRNHDLNFRSAEALLQSLDAPAPSDVLVKGRKSDDHMTLAALVQRPDITERARDPETVRLLWEVCQVPDFRKTLSDTHQEMIADLYKRLLDGALDERWVARSIERLDDSSGDVDALMTRIAHIRTWTFLTHRSSWVKNAGQWQAAAREVEDKLSDALHSALTNRFVDRRSAVLVRALEREGPLLAGIKSGGDVIVEGEKIGQLQGFRFISDETIQGADKKAVMSAARSALKGEINRRKQAMLTAQTNQFKITDNGTVLYQKDPTNPTPGKPVANLKKGADIYTPEVSLIDSELLNGQDKTELQDFLKAKVKEQIDQILEPLTKLAENMEALPAPARGIAHQLHEALGVMRRENLEDLIGELDADARRDLRARGVRMGPVLVYQPALGKPALIKKRALLWGLWHDYELPVKLPRDGSVSEKIDPKTIDREFYRVIGYPVVGPRAIRADMLDRLVCEIYDSADSGKFQAQHKMAEWLGCPIAELYEVIEALGHKKVHDPADEKVSVDGGQSSEEGDEKKEVRSEKEEVRSEDHNVEQNAAADQVSQDTSQADESAAHDETPQVQSEEEKPQQPAKPELATFALKRGSAAKRPAPKQNNVKARGKKSNKKPQQKPQQKNVSAGPKRNDEDSPFAVLKDMKVGK